MNLIGEPPVDGHGFRRHLDELDLGVRTLTTLVIDGIPRATGAFLLGSEGVTVALRDQHEVAWALADRLETAVSVDFARRSPVGSDLRLLLTVLRVAPALGRCLELIDHIAARRWVGPLLPSEATSAFAELARLVTGMWEEAHGGWCDGDHTAAVRLAEIDDTVDSAVSELPQLLRGADLAPLAAIQAVMVGRFYERLGAHALDFAKRTRWYAIGA
jgi:phosphate transport system protein